MKNRPLIICLAAALVLLSTSLQAQNRQGAAGIINEIKMSSDYIYAESTSAEWREARDNATSILERTLEDWLATNNAGISLEELMSQKLVVRARRGELYRAFIYVKKPDATPAASAAPQLTQEEKMMLEISRFDQIQGFISDLVSKNRIRDYGKYTTLPDGPAYLLVYNREGDVVSAIKKEDNAQTNLKTGLSDDVSTYKGCGAIWFRLR